MTRKEIAVFNAEKEKAFNYYFDTMINPTATADQIASCYAVVMEYRKLDGLLISDEEG